MPTSFSSVRVIFDLHRAHGQRGRRTRQAILLRRRSARHQNAPHRVHNKEVISVRKRAGRGGRRDDPQYDVEAAARRALSTKTGIESGLDSGRKWASTRRHNTSQSTLPTKDDVRSSIGRQCAVPLERPRRRVPSQAVICTGIRLQAVSCQP